MKAVKGNRCYTITETDVESFRNEGYDIKDDNGSIVAYGAGKSVAFEKYADLLKKYEALASENEELRKKISSKSKKEDK